MKELVPMAVIVKIKKPNRVSLLSKEPANAVPEIRRNDYAMLRPEVLRRVQLEVVERRKLKRSEEYSDAVRVNGNRPKVDPKLPIKPQKRLRPKRRDNERWIR